MAMRRFILLPFLLLGLAQGTTLEVVQVFQPLSLHGTDIDHNFEGKPIRAQIFSSPFVLSGAMPETLVASVAAPHRMPGSENYGVKESNLLALYQVGLEAHFNDEDILLVTFDLSKLKAPEDVELPIRTVLRLAIAAVKKSLAEYHHEENGPLNVRVEIEGTNQKNASLRDLAGGFEVSK